MNQPISQIEIEEELLRLTRMLEEETDVFAALIKDQAEREAEYKSGWAKEYLGADGPVNQRQSWADYALSDLFFQMKIADALVKAKREKLLSLRTSIDSLRTLAANLRTQT